MCYESSSTKELKNRDLAKERRRICKERLIKKKLLRLHSRQERKETKDKIIEPVNERVKNLSSTETRKVFNIIKEASSEL